VKKILKIGISFQIILGMTQITSLGRCDEGSEVGKPADDATQISFHNESLEPESRRRAVAAGTKWGV